MSNLVCRVLSAHIHWQGKAHAELKVWLHAVLAASARCTHFNELGVPLMKRKAEATQSRHAKLVSMGKSSHVSQRGLEKLCTTIDEEGVPTAFSLSTQLRARKTVCATRTPYGSLVESEAVVGNQGVASKPVGDAVLFGG